MNYKKAETIYEDLFDTNNLALTKEIESPLKKREKENDNIIASENNGKIEV